MISVWRRAAVAAADSATRSQRRWRSWPRVRWTALDASRSGSAPQDGSLRRLHATRTLREPPSGRIAFDTLKLLRTFEASNFTPQQAEALSVALTRIISEALAYNTEIVATKAEFSALKSELQILEKADFAVLRSDLQLVEKKMETTTAQIYTELERIENRVIKWVAAAAAAAAAITMRPPFANDNHRVTLLIRHSDGGKRPPAGGAADIRAPTPSTTSAPWRVGPAAVSGETPPSARRERRRLVHPPRTPPPHCDTVRAVD
eukprot:ctg_39.g5